MAIAECENTTLECADRGKTTDFEGFSSLRGLSVMKLLFHFACHVNARAVDVHGIYLGTDLTLLAMAGTLQLSNVGDFEG